MRAVKGASGTGNLAWHLPPLWSVQQRPHEQPRLRIHLLWPGRARSAELIWRKRVGIITRLLVRSSVRMGDVARHSDRRCVNAFGCWLCSYSLASVAVALPGGIVHGRSVEPSEGPRGPFARVRSCEIVPTRQRRGAAACTAVTTVTHVCQRGAILRSRRTSHQMIDCDLENRTQGPRSTSTADRPKVPSTVIIHDYATVFACFEDEVPPGACVASHGHTRPLLAMPAPSPPHPPSRVRLDQGDLLWPALNRSCIRRRVDRHLGTLYPLLPE